MFDLRVDVRSRKYASLPKYLATNITSGNFHVSSSDEELNFLCIIFVENNIVFYAVSYRSFNCIYDEIKAKYDLFRFNQCNLLTSALLLALNKSKETEKSFGAFMTKALKLLIEMICNDKLCSDISTITQLAFNSIVSTNFSSMEFQLKINKMP